MSVITLPLIVTALTERVVAPVVTVNAVTSGAAPASVSSNTSEIVEAFTDADAMCGATVSGVLFDDGAGPKFAVSFFVGDGVVAHPVAGARTAASTGS